MIGYHFRRLNELSGDVAAYARELENDMKAGKGKYDNLKGDELDKIVMRKQAVVKEFEQISNEVERARLNSPEAVQGAAEYAKLQEKARKSSEKLNARTAELRDRYPAFAPLMDNDVHIKVEPKRIHQPKKRPSVWDKLKGQA